MAEAPMDLNDLDIDPLLINPQSISPSNTNNPNTPEDPNLNEHQTRQLEQFLQKQRDSQTPEGTPSKPGQQVKFNYYKGLTCDNPMNDEHPENDENKNLVKRDMNVLYVNHGQPAKKVKPDSQGYDKMTEGTKQQLRYIQEEMGIPRKRGRPPKDLINYLQEFSPQNFEYEMDQNNYIGNGKFGEDPERIYRPDDEEVAALKKATTGNPYIPSSNHTPNTPQSTTRFTKNPIGFQKYDKNNRKFSKTDAYQSTMKLLKSRKVIFNVWTSEGSLLPMDSFYEIPEVKSNMNQAQPQSKGTQPIDGVQGEPRKRGRKKGVKIDYFKSQKSENKIMAKLKLLDMEVTTLDENGKEGGKCAFKSVYEGFHKLESMKSSGNVVEEIEEVMPSKSEDGLGLSSQSDSITGPSPKKASIDPRFKPKRNPPRRKSRKKLEPAEVQSTPQPQPAKPSRRSKRVQNKPYPNPNSEATNYALQQALLMEDDAHSTSDEEPEEQIIFKQPPPQVEQTPPTQDTPVHQQVHEWQVVEQMNKVISDLDRYKTTSKQIDKITPEVLEYFHKQAKGVLIEMLEEQQQKQGKRKAKAQPPNIAGGHGKIRTTTLTLNGASVNTPKPQQLPSIPTIPTLNQMALQNISKPQPPQLPNMTQPNGAIQQSILGKLILSNPNKYQAIIQALVNSNMVQQQPVLQNLKQIQQMQNVSRALEQLKLMQSKQRSVQQNQLYQ